MKCQTAMICIWKDLERGAPDQAFLNFVQQALVCHWHQDNPIKLKTE